MAPARDLHVELRRWFFSVLVVLPLILTPAIAWRVYLTTQGLGRARLESAPTGDISGSLALLTEDVLLCGLFLLALLLWHVPSMLASGAPNRWSGGRAGFVSFVLCFGGVFAFLAYHSVEQANCLYEHALRQDARDPFGFWEVPCPRSALIPVAAYLYCGLIGLLLLRALLLWLAHRPAARTVAPGTSARS